MGAVVTTMHVDNVYNKASYCGILRWCKQVAWQARAFRPGLPIVIFHNAAEAFRRRGRTEHQDVRAALQQECPDARVVDFDPELFAAAESWLQRRASDDARASSRCPGYGSTLGPLLKWQAVDPRQYASGEQQPVLYLDSDVDAGWYIPSAGILRRHRLGDKLAEFAASPCRLCASPDHAAPMNAGIMLLKPNASDYREGLDLLRTRSFSRAEGFNRTGSLRKALNATLAALGPRGREELTRTGGYSKDSWDFVCGDSDQGLFTTVYMARHARRFCVPKHPRRPVVHHFWAGDKPWHDPPSCSRYFDFVAGGAQANATPCARYLASKRQKLVRSRCRGHGVPVF